MRELAGVYDGMLCEIPGHRESFSTNVTYVFLFRDSVPKLVIFECVDWPSNELATNVALMGRYSVLSVGAPYM